MDGIPLVRASALSPYLDTLRELGVACDPMLARVRLPALEAFDPDRLIAYQQLLDFAAACHATLGLRLPLMVAKRASADRLGSWGRVLGSAITLGGFLETLVWTHPLHSSGARWWLADRGDELWLCQKLDRRLDVGSGEVLIYLVGYMVNAVRRAAGPSWCPREITIGAPVALSLEPLGIDAPVRTSDRTSVLVPKHLLSMPMPQISALLADTPLPGIERLLETAPDHQLLESVRQVLRPIAGAPEVSIELLAEIAGLSARTLQRRLTEAGASFRSLLQEVRCAHAIERVLDPGAKLIDVAFELGFSDPAHFTRAFRRWAGVSPSRFRRLHREGGPAPLGDRPPGVA